MKKNIYFLISSLLITIWLSSCDLIESTPQESISESMIKTAVASTLTVERTLAAGEDLSNTAGPDEDISTTPSAEETQEVSDPGTATEPLATVGDPWTLQSRCIDFAKDCLKYDLKNLTDSWLQVELIKTDTGAVGFFTVQSKTTGKITLIPGLYSVKYTWWCDGEVDSLSVVKSLGSWIDVFKCPEGFFQRTSKP